MKWGRIQDLMRRVRAYCDHPAFAEFEGDGIDAGMIRGSVQELADAIELGDPDIRRLFGEVEEDDRVRIGDVLHGFDPDTNGLREIPDDARRAPDALFLRIIGQGFTEAENITSRPVSRQGIEDAIDVLLSRLQHPDDGREAIQYIADQRFSELLADIMARVGGRTGHGVSARGLLQAMHILEYWRRRLVIAHGHNVGNLEIFWQDEDLESDPQSGEPDGVVLRAVHDDETVVPDRPVDPDELGDRDSLAHGSGTHVAADAEAEAADLATDDSDGPGEDAESDGLTGQKARDDSPDDDEPGGTSDP